MSTSLGAPNRAAIVCFLLFVAVTLAITWWAARRTRSTDQFYAAGRSVTGLQNGLALAGDYMSAASFLGIAGLVALSGFDGLIYSIGFLVGWPIVMFLIAEPLRNLGRYTFADVVAYRLGQKPVRIAAAFGTLAVVCFYLIAQMVGAGNLIRLLFGLSYEAAVAIVGTVMLAYVLFGGMLATTWVQIVKAVLLMTGALLLAALVLARFGGNPLALFAAAAERYGPAVLAPGQLVTDPWDAVSLGLALMLGTAGLPHILMRFYTVPDARTARTSVTWATAFIGAFYLLTFILGFGAMVLVGQDPIRAIDRGGNMAAPLLAEVVGGTGFLGFIAAVAFATILAVVAGLTLSGAAALSHDLWVNVVRGHHAGEAEQLRVARGASVVLGALSIALGIAFKGQNVAYMVGLAFAIAASANFPALVMSVFWRAFTTRGAQASMLVGTGSALVLIYLSPTIQMGVLGRASAPFPLRNPGLITIPLSFLVGMAVSLLAPERQARERFAEMERRVHLGAGALLALVLAAWPLPASAAPADKPTLALVGGQVIDGYEGPPIQDGVVLIAGDRILAVGTRAEVAVPPGTPVIDTEGMSVLPGLMDMHVHLMILGHADYEHWDKTYLPRFRDEIMPLAARQLLMAGVTTARDLGAPLEEILHVKKRIERGEIPGPRLYVSGPFIQRKPYFEYESFVRWGVNGPEDARAKVQKVIDAGVDMIKLIDQDQLSDEEVKAVVETAHAAGRPVVAHGHREDEIRMGLKHGVDGFEHTGLGTAPGYPEDVLAGLRKRGASLYWCPTIGPLFLTEYTARAFPERLDDPAWRQGMAGDIAQDIRRSLRNPTSLDYFTLTFRRLPTLADKFRQLRETGVTLMVGTDSGIPANFHTDSTWRELDTWVRLGMTPMQAIAGATRWPARFLKKEKELGTLAPGRYADVIAVRGDVLAHIALLQRVDVVVKNGVRVR